MTVSTQARKVTVLANGASTVFSYAFQIDAQSNANLYLVDASGTPVLLGQAAWSMSGAGNPAGGTFTYPLSGSPLATGNSLVLVRAAPYTQTTALINQGAYYPAAVEGGFDKAVREIQQIADDVGSAIRFPVTDPPRTSTLPAWQARINKMPVFDSSGNMTVADIPGAGTSLTGNASLATVLPSGAIVGVQLAQLLGYIANVRAFGAVGDGVTDDRAAIQAAANTGKAVYFPPGNYRVNSGINPTANGQRFFGDDEKLATITPVGNFDVFRCLSALDTVAVDHLAFNAIGMTGGYIFATNTADRIFLTRLRINDPFNVFNIYQTNLFDASQIYVQRPRGTIGLVLATGDIANRSDVIRLSGCNVGGNGGGARTWTGIYVDGCGFTVETYSCTFVNSLRGLTVLNTSGVTANNPEFQIHHDLEVDFSAQESVRLEAGDSYWFTTLYAQGNAAGPGIYVGPSVSSVKVANGYVRGHLQEGMVFHGQDGVFEGCQFVFNSFPVFYAYNAVRVGATASRVQFVGCSFGGLAGIGSTVQYGAQIDAGAVSVRFAGCDFYGCALGDVLDNAGGVLPGNVQVVGSGASNLILNSRVPGFEIGPKDGFGATATPTIVAGVVTGISALAGGQEYTVAPVVFMMDPNSTGSGFVATATIAAGAVTGIVITNGGVNYSAGSKIGFNSGARAPTIKARYPGLPDAGAALQADGAGQVTLGNDQGTGAYIVTPASTVNGVALRGAATGAKPSIFPSGTDANIDLQLAGKGTGVLDLTGATAGAAGALSVYLNVRVNGVPLKLQCYLP